MLGGGTIHECPRRMKLPLKCSRLKHTNEDGRLLARSCGRSLPLGEFPCSSRGNRGAAPVCADAVTMSIAIGREAATLLLATTRMQCLETCTQYRGREAPIENARPGQGPGPGARGRAHKGSESQIARSSLSIEFDRSRSVYAVSSDLTLPYTQKGTETRKIP